MIGKIAKDGIGYVDYNDILEYFLIYEDVVHFPFRVSTGNSCSFFTNNLKNGVGSKKMGRVYIEGDIDEFEKKLIHISEKDNYSQYFI